MKNEEIKNEEIKNEEISKNEKNREEQDEMNKAGQQRRNFLLKAGTGGAAALVGGGLMPTQASAKAHDDDGHKHSPAIFKKETFFDFKKPTAEAGNQFTIDLRDFQLSDSGIVAVRNAIVQAALDKVRQVGQA